LEVSVQRNALELSIDAVVSISAMPYILEGALTPAVGRHVFRFIQRNRYILLGLWDGDLSCAEVAERFRNLEAAG
jgi:hypothetical protein